MDPNLHSIPSSFGDPRLGVVGSRATKSIPSEPITQFFRYRNFTTSPISIGWRNGLRVSIPSDPTLDTLEFVTVVEIAMNSACATEAERSLAGLNDELSPEIARIKEALRVQRKGNSHSAARIVLEYPITLEALEAAGGTVYYSDLDILVSLLDPASMPPHPHSEEGRRAKVFAGSPLEHGGVGFGYAIEIVDNHNRYGRRFLNINGDVYPVQPKIDWERRDGVYVISNFLPGGSGGLEPKARQIKFCSFEQAQETLGLYRTYEEAMHLGDLSQARKAELLTMEHEVSVARQELKQMQTEAEKADVTRKEELAKLEGDNERLKARNQLLERDMEIERQKNKDYYEQKSQNRKDTSETVKILPTIILGITTIIATLFGIFSNRNGGSRPA